MRKDAEEKIIAEATKRFKRTMEWERTARDRWVEDWKFVNADSDNEYQWPNDLRRQRALDKRPSLTINKTRQHWLQVINDARQNKVGVKISATGGGSTYQSAQAFEGVVRHIEYVSNAQDAYDSAMQFAAAAGIGYWRLVTDYISDKTFDQDIFIRRIKDPTAVLLDPDINEFDGSDARFAFVFEDKPREEFEKEYPQFADKVGRSTFNQSEWISKDHVRVAEYYRRSEKKDKLISIPGQEPFLASVQPKEIRDELKDVDGYQARDVITQSVEWYLIAGDRVIDSRDCPGKYIPIVRVVGEETVIDGELDRKGLVRALKDPQRMFNYWASSATEFVALQGKTPYIASLQATEGLENYWENANRDNLAYLPYNGMDDQGNAIAPPQKAPPPVMAPAYLQGLEVSAQQMEMVSGQYDAKMGAPSNEISGVAIQNRERGADRANFHIIDNLSKAIAFTGRILIDLIPKVYDTPRVIRILSDSDKEGQVQINPMQQQAFSGDMSAMQNGADQNLVGIFNPAVGEYDVVSEVGVAYSTKRQDAFAALTAIAQSSPDIMNIAGDLIFQAADFPMADQLAERLRNMVPPQALGGPSPQMQQMQQQMQQLQGALQKTIQQLGEERAKRTAQEQQKDIDVYKAETDRMEWLSKIDPSALAPVLHQLIQEALDQRMWPVTQASDQYLHAE